MGGREGCRRNDPGRGTVGSLVLGLLLVLNGAALVPSQTVDEVLERASGHVERTERRLSDLVVREDYAQWVTDSQDGNNPGRSLVADVLLVKPRDSDRWEIFRDVLSVDGIPVRDREERLHRLFVEAPDSLAKIRAESIRFNLGPVFRDINCPTTALQLLEAKNLARFVVRRKGETTLDGVRVWKLQFEEKGSPTLFHNMGRDVRARCDVWVGPEDGRVWKTRLVISHLERPAGTAGGEAAGRKAVKTGLAPLIDAEIVTSYRFEERVGTMVPIRMFEQYQLFSGSEQLLCRVWGEARYSGFRLYTVETAANGLERAKSPR